MICDPRELCTFRSLPSVRANLEEIPKKPPPYVLHFNSGPPVAALQSPVQPVLYWPYSSFVQTSDFEITVFRL